MSERRACRLTGLARSTQRRKLEGKADEDDKHRLQELARERQRFGYQRLTVLLRREGLGINYKRVYRMYRELGLAMRRRHTGTVGSGTWIGCSGRIPALPYPPPKQEDGVRTAHRGSKGKVSITHFLRSLVVTIWPGVSNAASALAIFSQDAPCKKSMWKVSRVPAR